MNAARVPDETIASLIDTLTSMVAVVSAVMVWFFQVCKSSGDECGDGDADGGGNGDADGGGDSNADAGGNGDADGGGKRNGDADGGGEDKNTGGGDGDADAAGGEAARSSKHDPASWTSYA